MSAAATPSAASCRASSGSRVEGLGEEPLRAVFIRAPWVEELGPGVEVLAEVDGHPVAVRDGRSWRCAFHAELTEDSRRARRLHGDVHRRAAPPDAKRRRRLSWQEADERSTRSDSLAQILVRYSTKVGEGDTCLDRGRVGGRAADRGGLRGGAAGRRHPDRRAWRSRGSPRPTSSTPPTKQLRVDLARRRVGGRERRLPDRDRWPTPTPASFPRFRRSARRCARRRRRG